MLLRTPDLLLAVSFLAIVSNSYADTDQAQLTPDFAPTSIVYDEPPGKYEIWTKELPCGVNWARLLIQFEKFVPMERWPAGAKVILNPSTKGDLKREAAAIVLTGPPKNAHRVNTVHIEKVVGQSISRQDYVTPIELEPDHPIQIELSWTAEGAVTARFGKRYELQTKISTPITGIGLMAQSAKVEFLNLQVGHIGLPASCIAN